MKAIMIESYGGPEVLQRREVPAPEPGPGDIVVKVAFAGINFMDVHTRQGKYAMSTTYPVRLPCTLGMEGAGEVVHVGSEVSRFAPGDRVAWCIAWGSYAEYARVPAGLAVRLPDDIAYDQAAASLFQGSTAHYLLNEVARLHAGQTCLVHAASGNIGQLLVQMAKAAGVTVFATGSSPEKCAVAHRLGADHAMLYDHGRFADAIREATQGRGVDVVFDSVGKATLRDSFRATRKRGLVINYGNVSGSVDDLDPMELGESGSLFLTRPRLADHMSDPETVQRRADDIFAALASKQIHIPIANRYGFDDVEQAHAMIEQRQQIGKSVLSIAV